MRIVEGRSPSMSTYSGLCYSCVNPDLFLYFVQCISFCPALYTGSRLPWEGRDMTQREGQEWCEIPTLPAVFECPHGFASQFRFKSFQPGVPLEFPNVCMAMLYFQENKNLNFKTQVISSKLSFHDIPFQTPI